jgi:solute carrier family 10 (sodium/bile acid cotransporter), member 7
VISGVSLKFNEFKHVFTSLRFHSLVQIFNFLVISAISFGFSRILKLTSSVSNPLCDGVVISGCLPIAINMAIIVTKMCNGDNAMAVFQAALGNMIGVFVSPLLILGYLGVSGNTNLGKIFYELLIKVMLPLVVGQILQYVSKNFADFAVKYQKQLSKSQMFALIFVLYTVFCNSFSSGTHLKIDDFLVVLFSQLMLLSFVLLVSWYLMKAFYPKKPKLQIAGCFACSFKTVGLGVPIVNAIYKNSPDVSLYLLPVIMWHVLQLMIGSILAPRLRTYAASEDISVDDKSHANAHDQNHTSTGGSSVPSEVSDDGQDEEAQKLDEQTS